MKVCTKCGKEYPLEDFKKDRRNKDGCGPWCKSCHAIYDREYRKRNRKKVSERHKKYYGKNRAKRLRETRAYQKENWEKYRAYFRKYSRSPKGKERAIRRDYRKRSALNVFPQLTLGDWEKLLKIYNNRCAYCGAERPLERDHIMPIIAGGKHEPINIIPACQTCNRAKGGKPISELPLKYRIAIERHINMFNNGMLKAIKQNTLFEEVR